MKSVFYILIIAIGFFSCNKDDNNMNESQYSVNIESFIDFKVQDSDGNNLLYSEAIDDYTYDNIAVVYFEKGKEKVYNNPLLDASKGYLIMGNADDKYIRLYLNLSIDKNNESLTYLRIDHNDLDTIKSSFIISSGENGDYGGSSTSVHKVWYNGILILDKEAGIPTELPVIEK